MTLRQLCNDATIRLAARFGSGEAKWMVRIIMEDLKGYSLADLAIKADNEVTDWLAGKVDEIVGRLLDDEPIQYVFQEARFYGLKLKVTPATLIPRPETEELVGMIVRDYDRKSDLRVLDACTGSGCIALALARNLPFSKVEAFDFSDAALAVAEENNKTLRTGVDFYRQDALSLPSPSEPIYDIVVSNPPYIADHERESMESNVLLYEPSSALFVPDDTPLIFYHAIAAYSLRALKPGGRIYFELNPDYADLLAGDMEQAGWEEVSVELDIERKKRFLSATCPGR